MPVRREHHFFYPIDWPQLSAAIRFRRAQGRREGCGWPHGQTVHHLGDGRWWNGEARSWRNGRSRIICLAVDDDVLHVVTTTRVVLVMTHRGTANNAAANLAAWYQHCHILDDASEHRHQR